MAEKGKHDLSSAMRSLSKKKDLRIEGRTIYVLSKGSNKKIDDLGNGSWGKIDYLSKNHGFLVAKVAGF